MYLSSSKELYYLNISIYNNSLLWIGKNNYINGNLNIILSEQTNVLIGDNCLFSFGIWIRTADAHLVYDSQLKLRKNYSKSIFIGDHVWIGQNALILKGTKIGSGSIIGAMTVVSGKRIPSNTSWAGNPARMVGQNLFFTSSCVHRYTDKETKKSVYYESNEWIYNYNPEEQLIYEEMEKEIIEKREADRRIEYIQQTIKNAGKNRFYLSDNVEKERRKKWRFNWRLKK